MQSDTQPPSSARPSRDPAASWRGLADLFRSIVSQWRTERRLRRDDKTYRLRDPRAVQKAYDGLTDEEFAAINAPQKWVNWRMIPRTLEGLLPPHAATVIDLGCGTGDSTEVLTRCLPAGSRVIGFDISPRRLETAAARPYAYADGSRAAPTFVCQPIAEPLRDAAGGQLPAASVDLAHAAGVIGHHLDPRQAAELAGELRRVVKPGGAAVLDAGPKLDSRTLRAILGEWGFEVVSEHRVAPFNPRAQIGFRLLARQSVAAARRPGR